MRVGKAYILRAKEQSEIKEPWDYFQVVGVVPAEQAYEGEGHRFQVGDF